METRQGFPHFLGACSVAEPILGSE